MRVSCGRSRVSRRAASRCVWLARSALRRSADRRALACRHADPDFAFAGDAIKQADFFLRVFAQQGFQRVGLDRFADQDAGGNRVIEVMLRQKRFQRFGQRGAFAVLREKAAIAQMPPAADHGQIDRNHARHFGYRHHIGIGLAAGGVNELLFAQHGQHVQTVAQQGSGLEIECGGGSVHLPGNVCDQCSGFAPE